METFKELKSGTKLPLLNLKGKPYLQVAHRVVWFREEHPKGRIETELLEKTENYTLAISRIINEDGFLLASAHKLVTKQSFLNHIEKAETGAIGRALAFCGYGTQFEPELDEGEDITKLCDSPIEPAKKEIKPEATITTLETESYDLKNPRHKSHLMNLFSQNEIKNIDLMKSLSDQFEGKHFAEIKQILKAKLYEV